MLLWASAQSPSPRMHMMIMPTHLKGAITYGIFSNTGNRRRISGDSGRTWRAGRTWRTWRTWVSRWRSRRISGDSGTSGRRTGRRSGADGPSAAIRAANAGYHIRHRPRGNQTMPVPQHIHLAEQWRAILVLPDIRRAQFNCRVQMDRFLLDVLRH